MTPPPASNSAKPMRTAPTRTKPTTASTASHPPPRLAASPPPTHTTNSREPCSAPRTATRRPALARPTTTSDSLRPSRMLPAAIALPTTRRAACNKTPSNWKTPPSTSSKPTTPSAETPPTYSTPNPPPAPSNRWPPACGHGTAKAASSRRDSPPNGKSNTTTSPAPTCSQASRMTTASP